MIKEFDEYIGPFTRHNGIEICSVSPEKSVVKAEIRRESCNLYGFPHGGLMSAMADCAAGVTSRAIGDDYITISCHYSFLRNTKAKTLYAQAETLKRGRRIAFLHITIYDENNILLMDGTSEMSRVVNNKE